MKSKLNALLTALGFKQSWHVCWVVSINGSSGSYGDGTFTFRPHLSESSIEGLREHLAKETEAATGLTVTKKQINIIGMAKLGS